MNEQNLPKFIKNTPHGEDKYEGKSAERVAKAIKNHMVNYNDNSLAKIIGLDGEWGSGKSNIIRILKKYLEDDYYLFEYDAWGHQEDLQRRSFLETLTTELIETDGILKEDAEIKIKGGGKQKVTWAKKLKYLLARKIETETTSYPKVGIGVAVSFFSAVLTPICVYIAYAIFPVDKNITETLGSIVISILPILLTLGVWAYYAKKDKAKYGNLNFFLAVYQDKLVEGIEFETISEDEPSVTEFKEWMNDLSEALNKKLIIVYDNMDRLPSEKVKELWSSIHTFFSDNGYENIWVIIPFDKNHLANAFGEDSGNGKELTCHFINKTFPVVYRVAPPIVTDWKKTFNEFFDDAFGSDEDKSKDLVQRIFGIIKIRFTPRDMIAFINEMVSLKRTWGNEIPLLYIAVFVLKKDNILENPIQNILSNNYLGKIDKILTNIESLQKYMSALSFGIDIKLAEQIPLKQYLQRTLKSEVSYDINKFADNKHFITILDDEIKDVDPALIESAIKNLAKLDSEKGLDVTFQWNELVKIYSRIKLEELSFGEIHRHLLINSDDENKKTLSRHLYNILIKQKDFKGGLYYSSMHDFDKCIIENKLNISIDEITIDKEVLPAIFVDYMSQAKEHYKKYKLKCNSDFLNEYLVELLPKSSRDMDFMKYLAKDSTYSFDNLEKAIESIINENEITPANFPEIIKTYKTITKEKPMTQQLSNSQIEFLNTQLTDKNSEAYYDIVAMGLVSQQINTPYIDDGIDEEVAKRLEFYKSYTDLLVLAINWGSDLLRRSVKIMAEKSYGMKMSLVTVLPHFEKIKTALNIEPEILLNDIFRWYKSDVVTIDNIETLIPEFSFYNYNLKTDNKLMKHINEVAIVKLESIPHETLYANSNIPTYYWLNCASLLIKNSIISVLSDNLIAFSKSILTDIASSKQPIPTNDSLLGTIINKANKNNLQPTIKDIGIDYCNKTKAITPELFIYFTKEFWFTKKLKSRDDDIASVILNTVITDATCFDYIIKNSTDYIKIINNAGDDANDLKLKIQQILENNQTDELKKFASAIGIMIE